jgi:hypothetical protein
MYPFSMNLYILVPKSDARWTDDGSCEHVRHEDEHNVHLSYLSQEQDL